MMNPSNSKTNGCALRDKQQRISNAYFAITLGKQFLGERRKKWRKDKWNTSLEKTSSNFASAKFATINLMKSIGSGRCCRITWVT